MSVPRLAMAYGVLVLAATSVIVVSSQSIVRLAAGPVSRLLLLGDGPATATAGVETRAAVLEGDSWMQNLRTRFQERDRSEYRRSKLGAPAETPATGLFGLPLGAAAPRRDDEGAEGGSSRGSRGGTYRTMCVRLCDGYFYPVSFATSSDRFEDDQKACEQSCSSPARLYTYRNPGEEPEDMVSLKGQPYAKLPTAFQFRTKLDLACKCQPHPWEAEAMNRHRRYAEDEAKRKAMRQAEHDAKAARNARGRSKGADATRPAPSGQTAQVLAAVPATGPKVALLNAVQTTSDAPGPALRMPTLTAATANEPAELQSKATKAAGRQSRTDERTATLRATQRPRPATVATPPMRLGATQPTRPAPRAAASSNWRVTAFQSR